jgi:hypothetical protein
MSAFSTNDCRLQLEAFLRVASLQPGSKQVEQEVSNECDAPDELLVMFRPDILASRLERFSSKAIN